MSGEKTARNLRYEVAKQAIGQSNHWRLSGFSPKKAKTCSFCFLFSFIFNKCLPVPAKQTLAKLSSPGLFFRKKEGFESKKRPGRRPGRKQTPCRSGAVFFTAAGATRRNSRKSSSRARSVFFMHEFCFF
ncbi:MAG: hypothetical protein FWD39_02340 [Clostridiales bacterium]|nr:hypothetical protein [Clostridiales bacterium]